LVANAFGAATAAKTAKAKGTFRFMLDMLFPSNQVESRCHLGTHV
jgi:hypothetical protein